MREDRQYSDAQTRVVIVREPAASDTITLVELWLLLARRWRLMAPVFALVVVIGLAVVFMWPTYLFRTTLVIGSLPKLDQPRVIERVPEVLARVMEVYAPEAIAELRAEHGNALPTLGVKTRLTGAKNVVVVEARGAPDTAPFYVELLGKIADMIIADHARLMARSQSDLEVELLEAEAALAELEEEEIVQRVARANSPAKRDTLIARIERISQRLSRARAAMPDSRRAADSELALLSRILLDRDIQNDEDQLRSLEQELAAQSDLMSAEQNQTAAALQRAIQIQRRARQSIREMIDHSGGTRLVVVPSRVGSAGVGTQAMLLLLPIVAMIVAISAALFAEFLQRARAALDSRKGS